MSQPVTRETVENMTDEIYSAIEVNSEINLNINLQNKTTGNRQENKVSTSNILKSEDDKMFSSKEKAEFTTIYCYLSRNLTHNTNANNLSYKIAETLWRRKRGFKDLYFDLKSLVQH